MSPRPVVSLALVALIAGAIAAHADSAATPRPARTPAGRVVSPPATRPFAAVVPPLVSGCAAPMAVNPKQPVPKPAQLKPSTAPPSQALLDAIAILRRARTDEDTLPSEAIQALRARGLSPVSPDSARLLRSTPSGGKAWVVPVPDVVGRFDVFCGPIGKSVAREGLAVVATGDAASGGGGALGDLVRGRSPVTVAPCAGADHTMLSISGIVPNGVGAVYLTAPDGTAVRADVKDNGYEFLLPNQRSYEQRYVVWTGGDGTPHVQPVVTFGAMPASACKATTTLAQAKARVSPDDLFGCGTPRVLNPKFVTPARRPSRARRRRQVAQMLYVTRCVMTPFPAAVAVPGRPGAVVVPAGPVPAPPSAVPGRPVPAPSAVPPVRKHR